MKKHLKHSNAFEILNLSTVINDILWLIQIKYLRQ